MSLVTKPGPVITVPAGMSAQHLPVGLEFLVRPYDEAGMLRMAYAFEQATRARRAPTFMPTAKLT